MKIGRINKYSIVFVACLVTIIFSAIYFFVFQTSVNIDRLLALQPSMVEFIDKQPLFSFGLCLLIYTAVCSVPFPFVSLITLSMGYFFGFTYGLILVSFGSSVGASILFLIARHFISVGILGRFINRFPNIHSALKSSDMSVALGVRLIPGIPFFIPSLLFSLSQISIFKFYLSTQLGLLLTMAIYINAGATLSEINATGESLFSIKLIVAMMCIGLLPIILKAVPRVMQKN